MSAERLEVANRKTPIPFLVGRFHKRDRDGYPYYDVKSAVLRVLESPCMAMEVCLGEECHKSMRNSNTESASRTCSARIACIVRERPRPPERLSDNRHGNLTHLTIEAR